MCDVVCIMNSTTLSREDFDAGPTSLDYIELGLWMGNLSAALNVTILQENHINHILTIDSCPVPHNVNFLPDMQIKFIPATDLPYEDLLSHFDTTYDFIRNGQDKGAVLVHCYFGVSRSATVVCAFLMKKYSIDFDEALTRLKEHRRFVSPNKGFENQLRLYHILNYSIDNNNLQYKMFKLRVTANKVTKAKMVPFDCLSVIKPDPSLISIRPDPRVYRCKKCRRILALASNLLPHVKHEKISWKDTKWSLVQDYGKLDLCSLIYFIEPFSWISGVTSSINGKILCPKCNSKLGAFSWTTGCQCPCGAKMSPSFYLIPSKVDYSNVVQNVQITV